VEVKDEAGVVIAQVEKLLHVRRTLGVRTGEAQSGETVQPTS
jgi:hypothetical protein